MRTLTGTERTDVSASAGHWVFAYLEVTDDTGTLYNLGALSVGGSQLDFFNTATVSENIDSNTLSFSATMKREIGVNSLSPLRTDSPVNVSGATPGTYSPLLDLHREWRIMVAVVPRGTTPALPGGYTELASGIVDTITIDGLADTITVEGRGLEADILDAFVVSDRPYSGQMETVIQQALDDQLGVGVVPLYTPVSPSFVVDDTIGDINLMPALSDISALTGWSLRYRYDASDVNRFTLFEPNRNASTPDWTIDATEYEDLTGAIDLSQVRNYIKVNYTDTTLGASTIIAPGAESGTVSCSGGVATFSADQSAVLADGAIIVVDDVGYVVSAFDGTTGCTLSGAPDFSGKDFYTSASITRYGLRTMVIDLASGSQITDDTAAQNLADAVLSDLQDPLLVQTIKAPGLWFVQLHDYVQTNANGVHYNTDQLGGVTSYSHSFADGMLETTVGLAGSVKGRYTTWKRIGSGAAASVLLPLLDYVSAQFYDSGAYVGAAPFGQFLYSAAAGDRCFSIRVEHSTDPSFTTGVTTADNGTLVTDGFALSSAADRDLTYFFRFTPYSGGIVSGAVSGRAGTPEVRQVTVPPIPTNSSTVQFSRSTTGELTATVAGPLVTVPDTVDAITNKEVFVDTTEASQWLALSTIPTPETEVGSEFRRQRYLTAARSVRLNANIKALTGSPTLKLKYSTDMFGSVADVMTWTPNGTGLQSSSFAAVPSGAQTDVGLTLYVADGADTAVLNLYALDAEFRADTTVGGVRTATIGAAGVGTASAAVGLVGGGPLATALDPGTVGSHLTLSGSNLIATSTGSGDTGARGDTGRTSGRWYFEMTLTAGSSGADTGAGLALSSATYAGLGGASAGGTMVFQNGNIWVNGSFSGISVGAIHGETLGVAVDLTNARVWYRKNGGVWNGSASYDPTSNVGGRDISAVLASGALYPVLTLTNNTESITANFAGPFVATPPSGFF